MKYSEFKNEIKKLELRAELHGVYIYVLDMKGELLLDVSRRHEFSVSTDLTAFYNLDKNIRKTLLDLAVQLASTPLEDREDEKRYRLKVPFLEEVISYLNLNEEESYYTITNKINKGRYKTIFTESEIAELKAKHNLDSFVLEEVKEDE